jgi:hypothetical protein
MEKIYIGAPYGKTDKEETFKIVNAIVAQLIEDGCCVFSPITQGHALVQENDIPDTYEFWDKHCREFIVWCDTFLVLMLDDWEESNLKKHIKFAENSGKDIRYIMPGMIFL